MARIVPAEGIEQRCLLGGLRHRRSGRELLEADQAPVARPYLCVDPAAGGIDIPAPCGSRSVRGIPCRLVVSAAPDGLREVLSFL